MEIDAKNLRNFGEKELVKVQVFPKITVKNHGKASVTQFNSSAFTDFIYSASI